MGIRACRPAILAGVATVAALGALACEGDPAGLDTFQFCHVADYAMGDAVTARLGADDCLLLYHGLRYGERVHYYGVDVLATRTITLRMDSDEIDPKLIIWSRGTGEILAEDDDSGPGLNARIIRSFGPGRYIIGASSFAADETGTYTLRSE
jgi:hypothetical protein